jgi:DNA-binding SARP family transcriptional activator
VRYRILGVAQVEDERGVPLPLGGPRVRTLLTALALRPGRTTARGTLIDEVWADDPPLDAPAALQALVGRLRRAVGREAVDSEPGGYRLVADREAVDLFVFEDLVQRGTSALARGEADTPPAICARPSPCGTVPLSPTSRTAAPRPVPRPSG